MMAMGMRFSVVFIGRARVAGLVGVLHKFFWSLYFRMVSGLHGTKCVLSPPINPPFDLANTGKLKTIIRSAVLICI